MNLSVLFFVAAATSVCCSTQRRSARSNPIPSKRDAPDGGDEGSRIIYKLYTPKFSSEGKIIIADDPSLLDDSGFDPNLKTIVIIHGWLSNQRPIFSGFRLKDVLFKEAQVTGEYFNIILVDWSPIDTILYWVAARKVPTVGVQTARLLKLIIDTFGYSPDKFHIIGHSLGAHIAGETTRALKTTEPIITGLDPAGPLFGPENPLRLTRNASKNVLAIYTCVGLLSLGDSVGHTNIFPQGGRWMQPGCKWDINGVCSHCRSYLIEAEIILNKGIQAQNCTSYAAFQDGQCNGEPLTLIQNLFPSETPRGNFYFWSNPSSPFSPSSYNGVDSGWQEIAGKLGC